VKSRQPPCPLDAGITAVRLHTDANSPVPPALRRLLLLPSEQAAAVLGALQRQPGAAKEVLRPMGVKLLNADQAATVLMQRLDLLTGMQ
jgi:hypothetical protein